MCPKKLLLIYAILERKLFILFSDSSLLKKLNVKPIDGDLVEPVKAILIG